MQFETQFRQREKEGTTHRGKSVGLAFFSSYSEEEETGENSTDLLEEDVWGVISVPACAKGDGGRHSGRMQETSHIRYREGMGAFKSQPMEVPEWRKQGNNADDDDDEDDDDDDDDGRDDGKGVVPPHVIVAREHARREMANLSVTEGQGRTLKGRDQSNVRNAVWRSTGFLG